MKKTDKDKEFEKKLEQDLEEYFDSIEVPELSEERMEELRRRVAQNKPKRERITLWRRITAVASAMCLIALIIVPTVIMLNKKEEPTPPPTYYGKAEATKIIHTAEETQEIIATNFPKYEFIIEEMTYVSSTGFYNPTNNSLLSIEIHVSEKNIPYTHVEINIVASEQFAFDEKVFYTNGAEHTITTDYEIYKRIHEETFTQNMYGYIIFEDHELFVHLDQINDTLFNKFI